jgi:hypothetical protein
MKRACISSEPPHVVEYIPEPWMPPQKQVQTRAEIKRIDAVLHDATMTQTTQDDVERYTMTPEEAHELLHSRGFVLFREETIALDSDTRDEVFEKTPFVPIFNGQDDHGNVTTDGLRLQGQGDWHTKVRKLLKPFLTDKGLLRNKQLNNIYAVRSLASCPRQPKHTDTADPHSLLDTDPDNVPLALIYALQDNTKLRIWPLTGGCVTVHLQSGFMVVFRGDVFHCGMEYEVENTRIHAYIDSPHFKRTPNKTILPLNKRQRRMP